MAKHIPLKVGSSVLTGKEGSSVVVLPEADSVAEVVFAVAVSVSLDEQATNPSKAVTKRSVRRLLLKNFFTIFFVFLLLKTQFCQF